MPSTVLRARATCRSCRSKLPPRTEAWVDDETGEATCLTCHRFEERAAAPETTAPASSSAHPGPSEPVSTAPRAAPTPAGLRLDTVPPPAPNARTSERRTATAAPAAARQGSAAGSTPAALPVPAARGARVPGSAPTPGPSTPSAPAAEAETAPGHRRRGVRTRLARTPEPAPSTPATGATDTAAPDAVPGASGSATELPTRRGTATGSSAELPGRRVSAISATRAADRPAGRFRPHRGRADAGRSPSGAQAVADPPPADVRADDAPTTPSPGIPSRSPAPAAPPAATADASDPPGAPPRPLPPAADRGAPGADGGPNRLSAVFGGGDERERSSIPGMLLAASRQAVPVDPSPAAPSPSAGPIRLGPGSSPDVEIMGDPAVGGPPDHQQRADHLGGDADADATAGAPTPPAEGLVPWDGCAPEPAGAAAATDGIEHRLPPALPLGSTPATTSRGPKAKITPRLVPPVDGVASDGWAGGASSVFWETPTEPNPADTGAGARAEATRTSAPAHSGLLLAVDEESPAGEVLDRGDMGEGRIGQTLEGARVHGIEVIHGHRFGPAATLVDHVVISVNGVWVIRAIDVLDGRLERRDLGDWFNADQRLFIADADRSDLLAEVARQQAAVAAVLAGSAFSGLEVRGVLCFGAAAPGWVDRPFSLDGISVTWRRHLVEPMLMPVLLDPQVRGALTRWLATKGASA